MAKSKKLKEKQREEQEALEYLGVPKEEKTKKPRKKLHDRKYDEDCPICKSKVRDRIEEFYLDYKPLQQIANLYGLKDYQVKKHCESIGLDDIRVKNTYKVANRLVELGLEELSPEDVKPKDLIALIQHIDKREGRIINKSENLRPEVIVLEASLVPGVQPEQLTSKESASISGLLGSGSLGSSEVDAQAELETAIEVEVEEINPDQD